MVEITPAFMEKAIRRYFEACNAGDYAMLVSCFTPDAVHYFPPGLPEIPWRTADVKYAVSSPAEAHVDLLPKYTDEDVHNLMAYLETLR